MADDMVNCAETLPEPSLWRLFARQVRPAAVLLLAFTLLAGVAYPLVVTGIAQVAFPGAADGSLIERDGRLVGSSLIGQAFTDPGSFWSRPSATAPYPYNAAASSGSNLGPLNPDLVSAVQARIDGLSAAEAGAGHEASRGAPVDLVTASGSGLDPHISPAAAAYQVQRVATARGLSVEQVRELVHEHTEGRQLGIFGERRVNVLELNLALDELAGARAFK